MILKELAVSKGDRKISNTAPGHWSIGGSLTCHKKLFQWKGDCQETFAAKQGEKVKANGTWSNMDWTTQSTDFNIIKTVWDRLDEGEKKRQKHLKKDERNLEKYFWRLFKDVTRKLPKRVQTQLKNKGGYTKYSLPSLLELLKLSFSLVFCMSICFHMFQ